MFQVFASVGGLALLAEHLPLLYPEVSRQVAPAPGPSHAHATPTNIASDWVEVDPSFSFEVSAHASQKDVGFGFVSGPLCSFLLAAGGGASGSLLAIDPRKQIKLGGVISLSAGSRVVASSNSRFR